MKLLGWSFTFFVLAIIAAILGFGILVSTAAFIAKLLFLIFLMVFLISLIKRYL